MVGAYDKSGSQYLLLLLLLLRSASVTVDWLTCRRRRLRVHRRRDELSKHTTFHTLELSAISLLIIKPTTHAPETGARNSTPDSEACVIPSGIKFYRRRFLESNGNCSFFVPKSSRNDLLCLADGFVYIRCFHCLGFF